ncbi:hypothetical protein QYS46_04895 [Klebsiella michiganensis]|nr:hypothetical protein [Klebsiella michiganensis]
MVALPAGLVTGDVTASVEMPANVTTSDIRELIAMTMISVGHRAGAAGVRPS